MLTILLVVLALYIFWLLFRNGPAFAERVPNKKRNWVGPTSNQKEWQGYCSEVFQPFSSQTTFYAIAYFANFVAAANAILGRSSTKGTIPSSSAALAAILSSTLMMPWSYLGLSHWHASSLIGKWRYIALGS